jgi:hypothetical protein
MENLHQLIREVLESKTTDCGCGCGDKCGKTKAPIVLNESLAPREILSEGLKYHLDNKKPLTEHVYRAGSQSYFNLWAEARSLYSRGILNFTGDDLEILTETNLGEFAIYENKKVPLDYIFEEIEEELDEANRGELEKIKKEIEALMPRLSWIDNIEYSGYSGDLDVELDYELNPQEINQLSQLASKYGMNLLYKTGKNATLTKRRIPSKANELNEAKPKKKNPPIGKPMRGGSKKFYVYVRNPKTKRIKKVSFGQAGMSAKINNPKARAAFAKRHKCAQKTDRTKASYWSCRLPRYAKLLGLKSSFSGFW